MKNKTNKILAVALAVTLLALAAVAGTLAYLTQQTNTITNIFTIGDGISIALYENGAVAGGQTENFEIVAGTSQAKDISVTNTAAVDQENPDEGSCYVFITVTYGKDYYATFAGTEGSYTIDKYVTFDINETNWQAIKTTTNDDGTKTEVYAYATVADEKTTMTKLSAGDQTISLMTTATYPGSITTDMQTAWSNAAETEGFDVSLTVKAYAIQTTLPVEMDVNAIWAEFSK